MNDLENLLGRWGNFYLIMSAAASQLIGLLFVVITLAAERRREEIDVSKKIRVYLTPPVVYFGSVLGICALLAFPNHTRLTAILCICLVGVAGFVYSGSILFGDDKGSYYDRSDVFKYAGLPFVAYTMLVSGGFLLLYEAQLGLTVVAMSMLSLLTIAIRDSWAIAIGVVSEHRRGK
jgi:hypothetical protein